MLRLQKRRDINITRKLEIAHACHFEEMQKNIVDIVVEVGDRSPWDASSFDVRDFASPMLGKSDASQRTP